MSLQVLLDWKLHSACHDHSLHVGHMHLGLVIHQRTVCVQDTSRGNKAEHEALGGGLGSCVEQCLRDKPAKVFRISTFAKHSRPTIVNFFW